MGSVHNIVIIITRCLLRGVTLRYEALSTEPINYHRTDFVTQPARTNAFVVAHSTLGVKELKRFRVQFISTRTQTSSRQHTDYNDMVDGTRPIIITRLVAASIPTL